MLNQTTCCKTHIIHCAGQRATTEGVKNMSCEIFREIEEGIRLPEDVELLRQEEACGGETAHAHEIPESCAVGLEGGELNAGPVFRYSESKTLVKNAHVFYRPARITGVYEGALENPEYEKTAQELKHWQFQSAPLSCVVACENMAINDLLDEDIEEIKLRDYSESRGWYQEEIGTYTYDIGRIAQRYGLERRQSTNMTMEDLMAAKAGGSDLVVCVDAFLLEQPHLNRPCKPNHVVEVIGFDTTNRENPLVIINDTGRREGRGLAYPFDKFKKAACDVDEVTGKQILHHVTTLTRKEDKA